MSRLRLALAVALVVPAFIGCTDDESDEGGSWFVNWGGNPSTLKVGQTTYATSLHDYGYGEIPLPARGFECWSSDTQILTTRQSGEHVADCDITGVAVGRASVLGTYNGKSVMHEFEVIP